MSIMSSHCMRHMNPAAGLGRVLRSSVSARIPLIMWRQGRVSTSRRAGDDIAEWSDADIASSSACGGGYRVTAAGRCFLATTTVAVKSAWDLSVDQAEADALAATLTNCGDETSAFSATPAPETPAPTTSAPPPTAAPTAQGCVIAGKTAAQYAAVSGIGEVLSARLADAQPFSSRSDLETVRGIGPAKSEAVWSHFCRT